MRGRAISVRRIVAEAIPGGRYATHGIDSYPAKMVPHLARYAIQNVSRVGELVYDPFCGCGTVMVESALLGRDSLGSDINPVAVLLARTKSTPISAEHLRARAVEVVTQASNNCNASPEYPEWLSYWFSPTTLRKLGALRRAIEGADRRGTIGVALRAALILTVRRVSRADPRSPKPFISRRAREHRLRRHLDPFVHFVDVVEMMCLAAGDLACRLPRARPSTKVYVADSRKRDKRIKPGSIDAVVTSPPYLTAQDYFRSSKLELAVSGQWYEGIEADLGPKIIGSGRGHVEKTDGSPLAWEPTPLDRLGKRSLRARQVVENYLGDMAKVVANVREYLKPKGKCCLIIGNSTVQGVRLPVHRWVVSIAKSAGLELIGHDVDAIRGRRVPPQREGHSSVIDKEHLLFFQKPAQASQ